MQTPSFPPPVFVLAPPGLPGQTLAAALGLGPASYGLPELNLEQMPSVEVLQREMIGIRGPQLHGLLRAIAQLYSGEQSAATIEMAGRWMVRRAYMDTSTAAKEIAAHIAPRRMVAPVTASIFDKASLDRLSKTFPNATYVQMHMHPHIYGRLMSKGVARQIAVQLSGAVDETTEPPTPDPQRLWLMAEEALDAFMQRMPSTQVLRVDAETLITQPEPTLRDLAEQMDLPTDAAAMTAMLAPETSVFAGPGPMGAHMAGTIQSFAAHAAELPAPDEAKLDGAVPWREDGMPMMAEVCERAETMGYQ